MDEVQKVKRARLKGFWLGREGKGGYFLKYDGESEVVDSVPNEKVIDLADIAGKNVRLADDWRDLGRTGYGEIVTTKTARQLLEKSKEKIGEY